MSKHQYPDHIVQAIQQRIRKRGGIYASAVPDVLQHLWELSHINHPDDLNGLEDDALILDYAYEDTFSPDDFLVNLHEFSFPARVIEWGDQQ